MAINIDKKIATSILSDACSKRTIIHDDTAEKISDVLTGTHKTYRYVMMTALLAKSTDSNIDVFSLQAKDESLGAYDARSLCHKVIVPFERSVFPNGIGGSNEPYLNKPARFTRISKDNAVRKGNDTIALHKLISALSKIYTQKQAFRYLCHAVAIMELNHNSYKSQFHIEIENSNKSGVTQNIFDYLYDLLDKSCEGEICPITIATLEQLFLGDEYKVLAHKVNECGASSKEIGDIDIYDSHNNVYMSIEVKDKVFTKEDVEHAVKKFCVGNVKKTMFIYGKNITLPEDKTALFQLVSRFGRMGYFCSILNVVDYIRIRVHSIQDVTFQSFVDLMLLQAKAINATKETILWLKETANKQM